MTMRSPVSSETDAFRLTVAGALIVLTATRDPNEWQARTELERLRDELDVPVVQLAVAGAR